MLSLLLNLSQSSAKALALNVMLPSDVTDLGLQPR